MCEEKGKKTQSVPKVYQSDKPNDDLVKGGAGDIGEIGERLYNQKPLHEGYQPTSKLTSNPPTDTGTKPDTSKEE